jgi:hypothetical protein
MRVLGSALAPGADSASLGAGAAALQAHLQEAVLPAASLARAPAERPLREHVMETILKAYAGCGPRFFILLNERAAREAVPVAVGTVRPLYDDSYAFLHSAEALLLVHAVRAAPMPPLPAEAAWLTGAVERQVGVAEAALPAPAAIE